MKALPLAIVVVALASSRGAWADESDGDSEGDERQEPSNELTIVPFVGGDSDVGLGGGYLASLARLSPDHEPFLFRIESASSITFKNSTQGDLEIPYVDSYVLLDLPHVIKDKLRVQMRISYTRESTLNYYGVGNATRLPDSPAPEDPYFKHRRTHPTVRVNAEYALPFNFSATWGLKYTHNWLTIEDGTRLAEDIQNGSEPLRHLLRDGGTHGVLELTYGAAWDTRTEEESPSRGQYHTLRIDLAPGGADLMPHRWARWNTAARFYQTLIEGRLVLAARFVSDLLIGKPPFYELPRYDDTTALGGIKGVRGIPAQRYYGKIKLFTNTELRSELFDFDLFGKENTFGLVGFFDAGRLWADYDEEPDLDGGGVGIHYGTGGGVRVQAGESFVLRLDVAWSPDARPIAAYLASGHIF